jgi:hypothetical protein
MRVTMSLLEKKEYVSRAKAQALGKAGSVPRAMALALGTEVGPTSVSGRLTPRLCREPPTGSWQIALLCRELSPRLSAQKWGPQFTPSVVDGPVTRAKWEFRLWLSAEPPVPAQRCRERSAESSLSAQAVPRANNPVSSGSGSRQRPRFR